MMKYIKALLLIILVFTLCGNAYSQGGTEKVCLPLRTPRASQMIVKGSSLYMTSENGKQTAIHRFDISKPDKPSLLKSKIFDTVSFIDSISIHTAPAGKPTPQEEAYQRALGKNKNGLLILDKFSGKRLLLDLETLETLHSENLDTLEQLDRYKFDEMNFNDGTAIYSITIERRHFTIEAAPLNVKKVDNLADSIPAGTPYRARVFDGRVFIANGFHGIAYIGHTTKEAPFFVYDKIRMTNTLQRFSAYGTFVYDLYVKGNTAYMASGESGIVTCDTDTMKITGNIPELMWSGIDALAASTDGKILYAADSTYGLRVIDISGKKGKLLASGINLMKKP